jgi:hypothetical protein
MATSGSTDFSTTRASLVKSALRVIGVVAQGESPTTTQSDEANEALNMLIKAWQADGMPLWAIKEYSITPIDGTASYEIGVGKAVNTAKPLRITQAFFKMATGVDVPMTALTRDEYNRLGNKTSTGQPIQYYYDVQNMSGTLYVFPVPDAVASAGTNRIRIVYQRPYEDMDADANEFDFPQEWFQALKFGLAEVLAPEYGVPLEQYGYLRKVSKEYKDTALSMGTEEGSFYFQPFRNAW